MTTPETLYCSLDLELTGFDPTRDSILEVGFVFFRLTASGLEITEQWTQTFKPQTVVHPKILGLTGLTQKELDASPEFSEFKEFLQSKLGDAIIVGHNIVVDTGFLEASGLKLSGKTIDTLDLVQWLLPTHHSYNLENLMHYFQIPHPDAHRALADSIAVVKILEQMLVLFNSFSDPLKTKILELATKADFVWTLLFSSPIDSSNTSAPAVTPTPLGVKTVDLPENTALLEELSLSSSAVIVPQNQDKKVLLVVSDKQLVLKLWRQGLVRGIFSNQDLFNSNKFAKFLARPELTADEIKFCFKILVWQETNWQTETILDLNLTFFGGQFRNYISPAPIPKAYEDNVLCTDYSSLEYLTKHLDFKPYQLVLSSLHEFERELSTGTERRLSWQKCLYIFRNLESQTETNPATKESAEAAEASIPASVLTSAAAATDLFFGIVNLTVQHHFPQSNYVALSDLANQDIADRHIRQAAENYIEKVSKLFVDFPTEEVSRLLQNLKNFFLDDQNYIKWIETSQTNSIFFNQPLHVLSHSQEIVQSFGSVTAHEDFADPVLGYLLGRLGLEKLDIVSKKQSTAKAIQLKITNKDVITEINPESLPAILVMGNLQNIKEFYNTNYDNLKQYASLYAQGYSGGSNKIMRNFGIKSESILLVTNNLLLQQDHRRLKPKTLIITDFPQENPSHPYTKALCEYWESKFPNIRAILNLYLTFRVLKTCLHETLETVCITTPKGEAGEFVVETLQKLPFLNSNPQT